ncbi:MAG: cyclic pyranopterin monophosphate synthase MoaC [Chloroflexota bacterium]
MIEIYTDGAYNPLLGQGGWGVVIVEDSQKRSFSGVLSHTTSNRMEITAAIEGIQHTPQNSMVVVYTDSQYLIGCMARGWQRRANRDLWDLLDATAGQRKVRWEWVDGDSENPFHKEAHALATSLSDNAEIVQAVSAKAQASGKKVGQEPVKPVSAVKAAELSHIDAAGHPRMVDISAKPDTEREAVAKSLIRMQPATLAKIVKGEIAKGDVFTTAQLAGIMAAKETPHLIPLCHPILIGEISVEFAVDEKASTVEITARVKSMGKTGVEMEAMTAAAVAALTIYDMCKAVDRGMRLDNLRLVRKSGGKSGTIILEQG